jgi:hypothetical protein
MACSFSWGFSQNMLPPRKFIRRVDAEGRDGPPAFIMSGLFLVFPGLAAILRQISPLIT